MINTKKYISLIIILFGFVLINFGAENLKQKELQNELQQDEVAQTTTKSDNSDYGVDELKKESVKSGIALSDIKIRVLLMDQVTSQKTNYFCIKASKNIQIQKGNEKILHNLFKSEIYIQYSDHKIKILDKNLHEIEAFKNENFAAVTLLPESDDILNMNGTKYEGSLTFLINKDGKIQVINILRLDDYIYSVLHFESLPHWSKDPNMFEMAKIQAIICRTYAVYQLIESRKRKLAYDIKNNNSHQNYRGNHNHTHLRNALVATKDIIVSYDNKVALTMYDICCGGIIPGNMKSPNFKSAPYLARFTPCTYCCNSKAYSWVCESNEDEFLRLLKLNSNNGDEIGKIGKLLDVKIVNRDKAGIVLKTELRGTKKTVVCDGKYVWRSFKSKVRSQDFSIKRSLTPKGGKIIIKGHGDGHQMGLCQVGAQELVKRGWNYQRILQFYYPGTKLLQVNSVKF
ncbi:TPA: hypothetical protein DEO28_01465 [Candidatus Dependentiae bacterium]|nr:MAG: Lipoprotein [candidate division TM6 bacterium GW2011_GWE2_31_21]KKP53696.1 MAG: Lipoprotein [candidate division TM6 bacterium GW2011_GWF2_33_332]HBZ73167.1 hypothetical protein [Candidatus Dependentiae bacterium]